VGNYKYENSRQENGVIPAQAGTRGFCSGAVYPRLVNCCPSIRAKISGDKPRNYNNLSVPPPPAPVIASPAVFWRGEAISRIGKLPPKFCICRDANNVFARRLAAAFIFFSLLFTLPASRLSAAPLELDYMEYNSDANAQTAYVSNSSVTATGGTITEVGGYRIHTFTASGTFTPNGVGNVEYLVVAGGGAGGNGTATGYESGGGGAGGFLTGTLGVVGIPYTVTVGNGGAARTSSSSGNNGENSVFSSITAIGGGGGASSPNVGNSGGSGGGGSHNMTAAGTGTSGQGFAGATPGAASKGGGGGGASALGGLGDGGAGMASSISGTAVTYAGGGGGVLYASVAGGSGGGGAGVVSGYGNGTAGTANTGGGGGGANQNGTNTGGGAGGSGIVIVRYPIPFLSYSEPTIKTQGSYAIKSSAPVTTSLNKTLTRTVSPTINLSNFTQIKFDIRSTRTGSNIKIGIRDSGGTTTYITPNITSANEYQTIDWDISAVSNADKDAIDRIMIEIVNADASNTFYIDNFLAPAIVPNASVITSASSNSSDKITWSWQDNSSGNYQEDEFRVYSSTAGLLSTRTVDTTFWIETGLKRNKEYSRYIQAYNTAGSSNSATITWRTKPGAFQSKSAQGQPTRTGANAFGFVGDASWDWDVPVKSGSALTITAYIRYNTEYGGSTTKPKLTLSGKGISPTSISATSSAENAWELLTINPGTPSQNATLTLRAEGFSTNPAAKFYIDDINIAQ
jgi:hypothetical protein